MAGNDVARRGFLKGAGAAGTFAAAALTGNIAPAAEAADAKQTSTASEPRQSYARLRGLIRPPAFLPSCWVIGDHVFRHICVLAASA